MENDISTFTNAAKPISDLPDFEGMVMEPIQAAYLKVLLMQKGLQLVFICLLWAVVFFIERDFAIFPGLLAAGILVFLLGLSTFMTIIVFPTRKFLLREHDISYERGRIFYSMTTIPLNRIQHVSLGQGPLEKLFDLAHLQIFTAGGAQADMVLPGLLYNTAEKIKQQLLYQIKSQESTDQPNHTSTDEEPTNNRLD
ncbi:MAG: PH domain-containing protein [Cyclobacteriaceae bacterium]|nr:PH domain-containing protein [Cyclobacteriaceae bacterium]